jgi:hypothetical protein
MRFINCRSVTTQLGAEYTLLFSQKKARGRRSSVDGGSARCVTRDRESGGKPAALHMTWFAGRLFQEADAND